MSSEDERQQSFYSGFVIAIWVICALIYLMRQ